MATTSTKPSSHSLNHTRPNASTLKQQMSAKELISQNRASLEPTLSLIHRGDSLAELPDELFELTHLKKIEITRFDTAGKIEKFTKLILLEEISISNCPINTFPLDLITLPKLEHLSLSLDSITELPVQLNDWQSLTYLYLAGCDNISQVNGIPPNLLYLYLPGYSLAEVPEIVFSLQHIGKLVLSNFTIDTLPAEIGKLTTLYSLFVSECGLSSLPNEISNLSNIGILWLYENKLTQLPKSITQLKNLTNLTLSNNLLSDLPQELSLLTKLDRIELAANQFETIPQSIFTLKNLTKLDLSNYSYLEAPQNNITNIPHEFINLENLKEVDFEGNRISNVPPAIVSQGVEAIKSYLRQLEKTDKDYLFEAKLLILGEPGAGKTTLTRKLQNPNCSLPALNETTRGVEVIQYRFPINAEDFPDAILTGQQREFRLNMWDFGGQEIYKATHRFFLSDQAVYLLVADSRMEDTDFPYWLHIEEIFGGKSPVLIIINERDDRERDLDETEIKGHFANVKDVLRVDLNEQNKRRLTSIKTLVRSLAIGLPHVGNPVPATWTIIRARLEANPRQWIGDHEYYDLCEANGITDNNDARILSKYFHDIGVFLHFQKDDLLDKTIFLKPTWATNAVYKVLDDPLLKKRDGRFSRQEAAAIWHENQFARVQSELLALMQKFFLTYKISDSAGYIVPEKLPSNRPNYPWEETSNLVLEYKYEYFMPKGLLTQFIVEQHHHITNHNLVWRRGVVLEWNGAIAEVTEAYGARTIRVRIVGKRKRDFMTLITAALDIINKQYTNLVVEKFIPCNCEKCLAAPKPHFYEFKDLEERLERNQETVECRKSYLHVNVRELLDEVFNPGMLSPSKTSTLATILQVQNAENASAVRPGKIFISYSHKNTKRLEELQEHFETLKYAGFELDLWSDERIEGGMDWKEEIKRAMDECQVAILLVSTPFLASKFIMTEELPTILAAAKGRGVTLLSIVVAPCRLTKTPFLKDYQAMNEPEKPLSTLSPAQRDKVYMKVLDRVTALLPGSATPS